ncbi:MAG: hypothetical protein HW380_3021 [Magnetococcales bacterium]|nr:hypothetical protein [Magnetococcales bacterium]
METTSPQGLFTLKTILRENRIGFLALYGQPNHRTRQKDHTHEVSVQFFVPCRYATELLYFIEKPFDEIPVFVPMTIIPPRIELIALLWNDRLRSLGLDSFNVTIQSPPFF